MTFLACCNADGTERLLPLVIGHAQSPRCFHGRQVGNGHFEYRSSPRAWRNQRLFFEWLMRFDVYIGQTNGRRVALLIDNASCYGSAETLPILQNVEVIFLPKRTTSRIQSLGAGIIACIKRRFRRRQVERAVDLIEEGVTESLYSIDLYNALILVSDIWFRMEGSVFHIYWVKSGLVSVGRSDSLSIIHNTFVEDELNVGGAHSE